MSNNNRNLPAIIYINPVMVHIEFIAPFFKPRKIREGVLIPMSKVLDGNGVLISPITLSSFDREKVNRNFLDEMVMWETK